MHNSTSSHFSFWFKVDTVKFDLNQTLTRRRLKRSIIRTLPSLYIILNIFKLFHKSTRIKQDIIDRDTIFFKDHGIFKFLDIPIINSNNRNNLNSFIMRSTVSQIEPLNKPIQKNNLIFNTWPKSQMRSKPYSC